MESNGNAEELIQGVEGRGLLKRKRIKEKRKKDKRKKEKKDKRKKEKRIKDGKKRKIGKGLKPLLRESKDFKILTIIQDKKSIS
ncbi:hypothetical protein llap_17825 [Limosa lapponica baueri]|uniref:Uncharacterized protein n=1 Tax=Limosa lapponica baueri TaxID=1758121 RepID=A0A2I0TDJ7_LIMLA|nr:hypothetical protein llap_17825 [Limosa lapponica baueri]